MPTVLIVSLLILGFLVWRGARRNGIAGATPPGQIADRSKCKWVPTDQQTGSWDEYLCQTCNVTAYAQGGKPPAVCKKHLSGKL